MHGHNFLIFCLGGALLLTACRKDGEMPNPELDASLLAVIEANAGGASSLTLPQSDALDQIPADPKNPLTPEKIALGKLLFHETALGIDGRDPNSVGTFSCASCHHAQGGFQANRVQGIGEGGVGFGLTGEGRTRAANLSPADLDVQPLRTPSILNAGYQKITLWNGQFGGVDMNLGTEQQWTAGTPKATNLLGFEGVETQAIAGLKVHRLDLDSTLLDSYGYRVKFDDAFPDVDKSERYNRITAGLAIAAYERTVLANEAPFQHWLKGQQEALSDAEKRGAILFFGDANCVSCHSGPSLASMSFHALGMGDLHDCPEPVFLSNDNQAAHKGRGGFTMRSDEMYAFKTPQLYNLSDSPFYGHGSSFRSLEEVVIYKNEAAKQNARVPSARLSPEFIPLNLTDKEVQDLVAFLSISLHDATLDRYVPELIPSGKCFPNADQGSMSDLGCQ